MKEKSKEEIQELRSRLTEIGFEELRTAEDVDTFLNREGSAMIVLNSTCGCAGPAIRKGVAQALDRELEVDHTGTAFAGIDEEATEEIRSRAPEKEPSSPCIYLYRDGDLVRYIPRKFTMKYQYDESRVTEEVENSVRKHLETAG